MNIKCKQFFFFLILLISVHTIKSHDSTLAKPNFIKSHCISKRDASKNPVVYFLRSLYNRYILENFDYSVQPRIPKILHQIWFGGPIPEKYKKWQATWISAHPDWTYIVWNDETIKDFPMKNKYKFEQAKNLGLKSDIARYEILYQLGGVYVDFDMECLKSIDAFTHCCDFFACLEDNSERIGNAIIGSKAGNLILEQCLDIISISNTQVTGLWDVVNTTGPGLLTTCFIEIMQHYDQRCVTFPHNFFYPNIRINGTNLTKPETYAVHYWHGAWVK
jgi:mannosyltransferase OCH1-like enzyme